MPLEQGTLSALSAPRLFDEGIDIPSVDRGVVTSASRSTGQVVQRLGRVIRREEDGRPMDFFILFAADTATATLRGEVGWNVGDFTPS